MKESSRTNDCVTDIQSHSQISTRKDAAIVYGSGAIHFALFFHGARPGNRAGRTHPTIRSDISGCQNVGCALDSSAVTEPDTGLNFITHRSNPALAMQGILYQTAKISGIGQSIQLADEPVLAAIRNHRAQTGAKRILCIPQLLGINSYQIHRSYSVICLCQRRGALPMEAKKV